MWSIDHMQLQVKNCSSKNHAEEGSRVARELLSLVTLAISVPASDYLCNMTKLQEETVAETVRALAISWNKEIKTVF